MKTKIFGLFALTLGVAMLANAAMADPLSRTWNGRMQDDPANYNQSVGAEVDCMDMPCCKKMNQAKHTNAETNCMEMSCCKKMKITPDACQTMMSK